MSIQDKNDLVINEEDYLQINRYENGYAAARNLAGKWGYLDESRNIAIPFIYDVVYGMKEDNTSVIKLDGKFGLISSEGKEIPTPTKYTFVDPVIYFQKKGEYKNKFIRASIDGKHGFLDQDWNETVPCIYDGFEFVTQSEMFNENKLIVLVTHPGLNDHDNYPISNISYKTHWFEDKLGVIDLSNPDKLLIPCIYHYISFSTNGFIEVEYRNKYGIFNKEFLQILPCIFENHIHFNDNGYAIVCIKEADDIKYGVFDTSGKEIIPIIYQNISTISNDGCMILTKNSMSGIFKIGPGFSIHCNYESIYLFSEGLAIVCVNKKWGCIDIYENTIISPQYDAMISFGEGLAPVKKDNSWGFVNRENQLIIPFIYSDSHMFSEGLCAIKKDNKWGFIDKTGKIVISCQYSSVTSFNEGRSTVYISNYGSGDINKLGQTCGDWETDGYGYSNDYDSHEYDNQLYDAFEGEQDAFDEWSQR